jgi:hypothetical protein
VSAPGDQNLIQREVTEGLGSMRLGFYAEGKQEVGRAERSPIGSLAQQNPLGRLAGVLIKVENHSDALPAKSG